MSKAKKKPPVESPEIRILSALRRIIQVMDIHSRQLVSNYDVTAPQLMSLAVVAEEGPISLGDIAKSVHLSPSTIVGVLDRLVDKNYVKRRRDKKDRRLINVTITEKGRELIKKAQHPFMDILESTKKEFPLPEREKVADCLEKLVEITEVPG